MTFRNGTAFIALLFLPLSQTAVQADPARTQWTGLYVGVQGGYAGSSTSWTYPSDTFFTIAAEPLRGYAAKPDGAFAGGHLGFDYQVGSMVVGLEAAYNGTTIDQTRVGPVTPTFPNDRYTTSIDNLAMVTGRMGYALDSWLLYADGGFATAQATLNVVSGAPVAGVIADMEKRHYGWVAGGGVERMIYPSVILGLEYDYVRLDPRVHSTLTTGADTDPNVPGSREPVVIDSGNINLQTIAARLSIKLD